MDRIETLKLISLLFEVSKKLGAIDQKPRDFGVSEMLTRAEIHMLAAVGALGEASVTNLARHRSITKAAVSQLIRRLEDKGLVSKEQDERNISRLKVRLTDAGQTACQGHERVHDEIVEIVREHLGSLGGPKVAAFGEVLCRVNALLDELLEEDP